VIICLPLDVFFVSKPKLCGDKWKNDDGRRSGKDAKATGLDATVI
jgi:hypothetical protein